MSAVELILEQLEAAHAATEFPYLDNGADATFSIEATGYADPSNERWVLVFEAIIFQPRSDAVHNVIYRYGNCLTSGSPGMGAGDYRTRLEDVTGGERGAGLLAPFPGVVRPVGRQPIRVGALEGLPTELALPRLVSLIRPILNATEAERGLRIPADLPVLFSLNHWLHPGLVFEPLSESPALRAMATALTEGSLNALVPVLEGESNLDLRHWPQAGRL